MSVKSCAVIGYPSRQDGAILSVRDYPMTVRLASKVYSRVTMQSFLRFSRCSGGKRSLKCSVNSQYLPKRKEREWNHPGVVKNLFQLQ